MSKDGGTLYVACANSDTVEVIDTASAAVRESVLIRPDPSLPFGSEPDGVALSADGALLFVACAGNNAVAEVELPNSQHTNSVVQGFLPTDWYPGAVVADTNFVYVANVKGIGSDKGRPAWAINGTANKIPLPPDLNTLDKNTAQVRLNGRVAANATGPAAGQVRPGSRAGASKCG